jgi:hypothetical protein
MINPQKNIPLYHIRTKPESNLGYVLHRRAIQYYNTNYFLGANQAFPDSYIPLH